MLYKSRTEISSHVNVMESALELVRKSSAEEKKTHVFENEMINNLTVHELLEIETRKNQKSNSTKQEQI